MTTENTPQIKPTTNHNPTRAEANARLDAWIAALRSGEYQQGKSVLRRTDDTFCCLGVGCYVFHKETGEGYWENDDEEDCYSFGVVDQNGLYDDIESVMPSKVQAYFGLTDEKLFESSANTHLFNKNDFLGWSFNEIADYIDNNRERFLRDDLK